MHGYLYGDIEGYHEFAALLLVRLRSEVFGGRNSLGPAFLNDLAKPGAGR